MHRRAIFAIARKDALDILVNKMTLIGLLTPILLALLFVFLNQVLGASTSDILIYDPGNSPLEQAVGAGFSHPRFVRVSTANDVISAFGADGSKHSSSYTLGLVIPDGFEGALQSGQRPTVQFFINGDRSSLQQQSLLTAVITDYARHISAPTDPVQVQAAMINPPSSNDISAQIGTFYALAATMASLYVGMSLVANMVVEERERKTLRMLLVSPASLVDIVIGKSGVAFGYQLLLALIAMAITGAFIGQVGLSLLFILIGTCFSLALGLLVAGIFQSTSATGAFSGVSTFIFIVPVFFIAPFFGGSDNTLVAIFKLLPTYYIGDGLFHAFNSTTSAASLATDLAVGVGSVLVLFALAVWALRRQASQTVTI